jgi:hypothetical protein
MGSSDQHSVVLHLPLLVAMANTNANHWCLAHGFSCVLEKKYLYRDAHSRPAELGRGFAYRWANLFTKPIGYLPIGAAIQLRSLTTQWSGPEILPILRKT